MNDEQYKALFEEVFRETEERVPDLDSLLQSNAGKELPVLRTEGEGDSPSARPRLRARRRLHWGMVAGIALLATAGLTLVPTDPQEDEVDEPMATYLDLGATDFLQPQSSGLSDWRSSTDFLLNVE